LKEVAREIYRLHHVFAGSPNFGVTANMSQLRGIQLGAGRSAASSSALEDQETDVVVATPSGDEVNTTLASYYADPSKNADREPVFSLELGLAIEELREGVTLHSLWQV
jgi:hypothetical protein